MLALTPSERRGALVLVLLLLIGAGHDLWRAHERAPGAAGTHAAQSAPMPQFPAGPEPGLPQGAGFAPDSAPPESGGTQVPAPPRHAAVDLNRAGVRELDGLPGIGPVIAGRIVLQRRRFGPFQGVDELLAVRGVGPRLLERIRPWATVGPGPNEAPRAGPAGSDSVTQTHR